jgi:signal transduction histidine kinase
MKSNVSSSPFFHISPSSRITFHNGLESILFELTAIYGFFSNDSLQKNENSVLGQWVIYFIFPVTLIIQFAIVSYIFLNRMIHYVNAIKERYDEKMVDLTKDATYKAVTSGTTMLNHTMKNEVLKISMSIKLIKSSSVELNPDIDKYLKIINDSTDHMMGMVTRIHSICLLSQCDVKKRGILTGSKSGK